MKKIIALLICVITVLGLFVGCSDNGVPVTDPNGPVLKTENYFFNAIEVEYFRMLSYRRMYEAYESALGEDVAHEFATNAATKAKIRASLEQILKLCEEAKVRGIEVGAEEKEYAESVVMDHIVKARNEGKEVEDIYGKNVTHENMLKVLELEALSKKVESIIYKELEGEILNDSAKVNTYIKANGNLFYKGSFIHATVTTDARAEKLKGITDKTEFIKAYTEMYVRDNLLAKFNQTAEHKTVSVSVGQGDLDGVIFPSGFEPVESISEEICQAVILMLVDCVEAKEMKGFVELNEARLNNAYKEINKTGEEIDGNMKIGLVETGKAMLSELYAILTNAQKEDSEGFFEWFTSGVEAGQTYVSGYEVYLVTGAPTIDTDKVRSMAQIFVKVDYTSASKNDTDKKKAEIAEANEKARNEAKEKIEGIFKKIGVSLPLNGFVSMAEKNSDDATVIYENVPRGKMPEEIDTWLYSNRRSEGNVNLIETENGFHLVYYIGTGDITNKDHIVLYGNGTTEGLLVSSYEEWLGKLAYTVTVDETLLGEVADKEIAR